MVTPTFVDTVLRQALTRDQYGANLSTVPPVRCKLFGSYRYGIPQPHSDLDLVCLLPNNLEDAFNLTLTVVLDRVAAFCKQHPLCSQVTKTTDTVKLRYQGHPVDIGLHVGNQRQHWGSRTTAYLKHRLSEDLPWVRRYCLLVADWACANSVCYDGRGSIGEKLKKVHWVFLALAYLQTQPMQPDMDEDLQPGHYLGKMLHFYKDFDFAHHYIDPGNVANTFQRRRGYRERSAMFLRDPLDGNNNLAQRVAPASVGHIQTKLHKSTQQLQHGRHRAFWQNGQLRLAQVTAGW